MDFLSLCYIRCVSGIVDLKSSSITPIRCGSTNLEGRKLLYILNSSNKPIYIGSEYIDNNGDYQTVTTHYLAKYGIKLAAGDAIWLPVSEKITIYGMAHDGVGKRLRIMELS